MNMIIIDGNNSLYRFGFAFKGLIDATGRRTSVVYGLLNELLRLKNQFAPCRFVLAWDGQRTRTNGWRVGIYPQYKNNRTITAAKASSEDINERMQILAQIPAVKEVCALLGVPQVEVDELEADDAISVLAFNALQMGLKPVIVSTDKDFIQLIPHGIQLARG